jgi:hypothetical protein
LEKNSMTARGSHHWCQGLGVITTIFFGQNRWLSISWADVDVPQWTTYTSLYRFNPEAENVHIPTIQQDWIPLMLQCSRWSPNMRHLKNRRQILNLMWRRFLAGAFNHLETYEFVNGKQDIPNIKWTVMFETTNQIGK